MRGDFFSDVANFRKDLDVEWLGNSLLSPSRVVQCCLKSGSGTLKSTFLDLAFRLTMNWNLFSGE